MHIFHRWGRWSTPEQTTLSNALGQSVTGMVQHRTRTECSKVKWRRC